MYLPPFSLYLLEAELGPLYTQERHSHSPSPSPPQRLNKVVQERRGCRQHTPAGVDQGCYSLGWLAGRGGRSSRLTAASQPCPLTSA